MEQAFCYKKGATRNEKNHFSSLFPYLLSVIFTIFFVSAADAQTISGIVTDTQNNPISAAEVTISVKAETLAQTATDAEGKFSVELQNAPENFLLLVKAEGFADFSKTLAKNFGEELKIVLEPQNLREDVTISIANTETRLSETPASVVVLTRETLSSTAAQTTDDALRQIAGFGLFRRSSSKTTNPTAQGANFRGLAGSGASRAGVLLDGVSVNDAFGGWTYWTRIPRVAVRQIEVLRGGASALYGDAALSGAINLVTENARKKPVFRFETSAGSQKTFDGSAFGAFQTGSWNVSASFDAFQTGGYIPITKDERGAIDTRANSRYENAFLTLERIFAPADAESAESLGERRIFVRGNYFTERRDNGTSLTYNQTRFRQTVFGADFGNQSFGRFALRAGIEKQIYDQTFSAISNSRNTETLSRLQRVPSQSAFAEISWRRAFSNHFVSASADVREVRGASDEIVYVNNLQTSLIGAGGRELAFSVSAQDFWRVSGKLNVSFGARFDRWKNADAFSATRFLSNNQTSVNAFTDRNESAFSPRVAALYQINRRVALYGSFAKSFRAPVLNELYRAFRVGNVLTLANENLRAERARTFEAGANFNAFESKLNLRANFFASRVALPVVSVTLTTTPALVTRQRQNVGATRARGVEIDGEYRITPALNVTASFLAVASRVADFPANPNLIGKFLPQVARAQFNFQIFYRPPAARFSASLQTRFSGAQFEDDLNELRLRPFTTTDLFAGYRIHKKVEIYTALENVFDARYDIALNPARAVAPPRFARVGLRFDLRRGE